MKKYINRAIKVVAALLIFTVIFQYLFGLRGVMKMGVEVTNVSYYQTFYDLPKNSIDGIVIGNSVAHRGWSDVTAWHESGMAVYSLATENQPLPLSKYVIEEALRTQDLKFVIIELHTIRKEQFYNPSETYFRRILDVMPLTKNKLDMVKAASKYYDKICEYNKEIDKTFKKVELDEPSLKLPFLKYHSSWKSLKEDDYMDIRSELMSTYAGMHMCEICYINPLDDINLFGYTDEASGLLDYQKETITDLLDYLKKKNLQAIFVSFPSKLEKYEQKEMNETIKMIEDYDYDKFSVCNMNTADVYSSANEGLNAELKIDWNTDFYGADHVNSYGNDKTTKYLMNFIKDRIDVEDKRGQKKYKAWDTAYDKYIKIKEEGWKKSYTLTPFEDWKKVGGWTEKTWASFTRKLLKEEKKK